MSQSVLFLLKRKDKLRVETDTSGYAIGGILSQEQDKELLAVVEVLTK